MSRKWLTTNATKIGISTLTDSLTPRRFRAVSPPTIRISHGTLSGASPSGMNENSASTPDATEMAIVST